MAWVIVALAPARPAGCPSLTGLDSPYWGCWYRLFVSSSQQSGSRTKGPHGGIRRRVPLTAPPTAFSHRSLRESTRSPWEYKSSGWISVSLSVGSHGNLDHVAESAWVALVQPPACVVTPLLVAPPAGQLKSFSLHSFPLLQHRGWVLTWLCASPVLLNLVWTERGSHSPSVLLSLPWYRYFNQVSRYNKIPISALQATRRGRCKSH